jgi:hypothetical protein
LKNCNFRRLRGYFDFSPSAFSASARKAFRSSISSESISVKDAVADLRVLGDDRGHHEERAVGLKLEFEVGADGKGREALDVTAVQAEVGGSGAKGNVVALEINLNGRLHFEAGITASLWGWRHLVQVSGGGPPSFGRPEV